MQRPNFARLCLLVGSTIGVLAALVRGAEPITPHEVIPLFNGKDLSGLTTWLKDAHERDPRGVFRVTDGMIHLSGEGNGYVATKNEYRDYRLVVEYKWGRRTDGGRFVRNSGILLHAVGADGGAGGAWPSCIECQLAQGCAGDLIVIRGKDTQGETIPVQIAAETELAPDGRRHRWKKGGELRTFPPTRGQLWWSQHDWDFREFLDTRGKDDLENPLGDWNHVECVCNGDRIAIFVNGQKVNECRDAYPAAGRILLQTEGFEIYFRKFELHPLGEAGSKQAAARRLHTNRSSPGKPLHSCKEKLHANSQCSGCLGRGSQGGPRKS